MSIYVINSGVQTTIQDLGRRNKAHLGISAAGAADAYSMKIANIIVGNNIGQPILEMTLFGGEYKFQKDAIIAFAGSIFKVSIDGESIEFYKSYKIKNGCTIKIGPTIEGARCYLAVRGGLKVPSSMNSHSTHILSGIGGHKGRALKKGDEINIFDLEDDFAPKKNFRSPPKIKRDTIRITEGIQHNFFSKLMKNNFLKNEFKVSTQFDRMGIHLQGPKIIPIEKNDIITEGIPLGGVQIPGNGNPIISFVDHQTTGGYPKIANVITADLCKVGQLKPDDQLQFEMVTIKEAEYLRLFQEKYLSDLQKLQ
tara:strand:- start:5865 stop:6794 length:930 start_codon:yes stop_codon:yes gene_type:complete